MGPRCNENSRRGKISIQIPNRIICLLRILIRNLVPAIEKEAEILIGEQFCNIIRADPSRLKRRSVAQVLILEPDLTHAGKSTTTANPSDVICRDAN